MQELIERVAPRIRLPGSAVAAEPIDGGLRDPASGAEFRVRDGVLDLLDPAFQPTATQRSLDFAFSAWLYDVLRPRLAPLFRMPSFGDEVSNAAERLDLQPGDALLDVACGQGNFTLAFAERVGPDGLVVGIDIANAMLARAARHVRRSGARNVFLIRGDALALPFVDAAFPRVACSGGLHQIPDLPRAIVEFRRVSTPDGRLVASGFATAPGAGTATRRALRERARLDAVDLGWLKGELEAAGFADVSFDVPGGRVGYVWGRCG